jgi:hypothetical protein
LRLYSTFWDYFWHINITFRDYFSTIMRVFFDLFDIIFSTFFSRSPFEWRIPTNQRMFRSLATQPGTFFEEEKKKKKYIKFDIFFSIKTSQFITSLSSHFDCPSFLINYLGLRKKRFRKFVILNAFYILFVLIFNLKVIK